MSDYILFLDTETTDRPQNWDAPTEQEQEWPYILQLAWVICKPCGEVVKTQNFYLDHGNVDINPEAQALHGLTLEFLQQHGTSREHALSEFSNDLQTYNPLLVGHFLRFDIKMLEVAYHRAQQPQQLKQYEKFCTMFGSRHLLSYQHAKLMKLDELHRFLFNNEMEGHHNALGDAKATQACFFGLQALGKLTSSEQEEQARYFSPVAVANGANPPVALILPVLVLVFVCCWVAKA